MDTKINHDIAKKKADLSSRLKPAFAEFMTNPQTKLALSLIPPSEVAPEALPTLLEAAFEAGACYGAADVGMVFIDTHLQDLKKRVRDGG